MRSCSAKRNLWMAAREEQEMASTTVNGVDLYYTTEGTGPSLVLVHGSWGDADNWAPVVPQFARQCVVVAYDRRGHSRSGRPSTQGSVHEDVADLAALIETLGLAPTFVCGNSYGALITLRLAAARADLVRGIAVHEPPGVPLLLGDPAFAPVVEAFAGRMTPVRALLEASEYAAAAERFVETIALGPGQWRQLPESLRQTFVRNAPTYLDELLDPECLDVDLDTLALYSKPALLTQGDQSPPMFAPILDRIAQSLPRAERHVYAGAGHVPHVSHPADYARVNLDAVYRVLR
jgi:pimeloyl-ACP methyl ester carboxylesterase